MLEALADRAGLSCPPRLVVTAQPAILAPCARARSSTIRITQGLVDHYYVLGRVEDLDVILGHELANLIQREQGRPFSGIDAEFEADKLGVELSGQQRSVSIVQSLGEILGKDSLPTVQSHPALKERLRAIYVVVQNLEPVAPQHDIAVGL